MNRVLLVGAVVLGLVLAISLWHATDEPVAAPTSAVSEVAGGDVVFAGGLSRLAANIGEPVGFWVTIRNRSSSVVRDVRLPTDQLPGYQLLSGCWCSPHDPSCIPGAPTPAPIPPTPQQRSPDCHQVAMELAGGQSLSIWGELQPNRAHPPEVLFFVVRWSSDAAITSQIAVPLGRIEVRTATAAWLASIRQFATDFGLSLTLAVLGFLFTIWEKQRQNRQQASEKEREDQQRAAEKEKEQVVQTWNMMLPISHALNTEYYIKLQRAASLLVKNAVRFGAAERGSGEQLTLKRRAFYCWALLRRHIRHLTENSGFYFKDRTGEALANLCGVRIAELFQTGRNEAALQRLHGLMGHVQLNETLAGFLHKLDDTATHGLIFQECLSDFEDWMSSPSFPPALLCLKGLRAVLEYEVNRPYQYWYGSRESLHIDATTKAYLLQLAQEVEAGEAERRGFKVAVERYLAEGSSQ